MLAHLDTRSRFISRRGKQRRAMRLALDEAWVGGEAIDVVVHDLSVTGLLMETDADLDIGDVVQLTVPETGPVETEVMWRSGRFCGCQFEREVSNKAISAALLKSAFGYDRPYIQAAVEIESLPDVVLPAAPARSMAPALRGLVIGALALAAWVPVIAAVDWLIA